jgi:hypothetical protein
VGTTGRPTPHDLIPLGDYVLKGDLRTGESAAEPGDVLLVPLWTANLEGRAGIVEEKGRREQLICERQVGFVPQLRPAPDQRLVLFC